MLDDYFLKLGERFKSTSLRFGRSSLRGLRKNPKRNILLVIILVVITSLFFSAHFSLGAENDLALQKNNPAPENLDPLEKISKGYVGKKENDKICENIKNPRAENNKNNNIQENILEDKLRETVKNYPIEEMLPAISKEDKDVAAYLIGIAKKESSWGEHAPYKNGRDCFNYWGYKGGYNSVLGGYSCFDSPEQAVQVVGGRIAKLISQKVDAPGKMVTIWKCGGNCSGFDQDDVKRWASVVGKYFYELNS